MSECIARIPLRTRDGEIRAYAIVDADDYEWAKQYRWHLNNSGYAQRNKKVGSKFRTSMLHRELLTADPQQIVDHANRNTLDNRRRNLRIATHAINRLNSKLNENSGTGYRGVYAEPSGKYRAQIRTSSGIQYLGLHETPEQAARAYDNAAREHNGEFAMPNFPEGGSGNA